MLNHKISSMITIKILATVLFAFPVVLQAANQLTHHPSPYLALHANDPVNWQIWSKDVLERARHEKKLIFISVGYFSCHWCHVMQRESYQDTEIAELLNQNFIAVKVDRELRPELDHMLISFVTKLRGAAGWPLNVFLTPDGYPMTGFTYQPREKFAAVLVRIRQQWLSSSGEISDAARQFFLGSQAGKTNIEQLSLYNSSADELTQAFITQSMLAADELQGGFGSSNKFPQVPQLSSLLKLIEQSQQPDADVVDFIKLSLRAMASRHLMDQVNGGFFRYTTDPDWQTPHFEKMLYDNAQLALLYLQAEGLWPGEGYREIAELTLSFLQSNMRHPLGGYMSSLSAVDEHSIEGGAYFWNWQQISQGIGDEEANYLRQIWSVANAGISEEPFLLKPLIGIGAVGDISRNNAIRLKLQGIGRPKMPADDKRLASSNALTLQALVAASAIDKKYQAAATRLYQFMRENFFENGELLRFAGHGQLGETTFQDYADVSLAFLQYGQSSQDETAIQWAKTLAITAYHRYFVAELWQLNNQSLIPSDPGLWVIQDAVMPSPMALWLEVILASGEIDPDIRQKAGRLLRRVSPDMLDTPFYYGSLIALRNKFDK